MIELVLLALVLAAVFGRRSLARALGRAARVWRLTGGLLAVVLLTGAAVLAVREAWAPALLLAVLAGAVALGARFRRRPAVAAVGMTVREARSILGVPEGAPPATIDAAYRRLMRSVHPDQGGTTGLAAQLNAARAVLMRG